MTSHFDRVAYAVTICDLDGTIIYMNAKSTATFSPSGESLIGRNLSEFHGPRAKSMIDHMLQTGESNSYTIQKGEIRKIIHQSPWMDSKGNIAGLIELSIPIPVEMPHYIR